LRFSAPDKSRIKTAAPTALSVLLLVLFAHAFIVSATHMHRLERAAGAASAGHVLSVRDSHSAEQSGESGAHAQCLLCRLQRNFISDYPDSSLTVAAPPLSGLSYDVRPSLTANFSAFLTPSGRAPPSA
jgi:hypothetical protein